MSVAEIFETMEYGPAPESAGPAQGWLEAHGRRFGLFVGGEWTGPEEERLFETVNPGNGRALARVTQATQAEVDAAVEAARSAFETWSRTPGHVRARYLYAIARQ